MQLLALLLSALSMMGMAAATAQQSGTAGERSKAPPGIDVEFGLNHLADGTRVAAIFRRPGQETLIRQLKVSSGRVQVVVPPGEGADGDTASATIFLIAGMSKVEQFDEFLAKPAKWTWAQLRGSPNTSGKWTVMRIDKGWSYCGRARVVGLDGKPLPFIQVGFWERTKDGRGWKQAPNEHVGYDPNTGLMWTQHWNRYTHHKKGLYLEIRPCPFLKPNACERRLAPLLGVSWPRAGTEPLRIRRSASIRVQLPSLFKNNAGNPYGVTLSRESGVSFEKHSDQLQDCVFHGLPPGVYRIRLQVSDHESPPAWESRPLHVKPGDNIDLGAIDLGDKFKRIQVTAKGPGGKDLYSASIGFVTYKRVGNRFVVKKRLIHLPRRMPISLVVPKEGIPLIVTAIGMASQIHTHVKDDAVFTMRKAIRVDLRVAGIDEHPALMRDLYLRAEPVGGYPRWAWQMLTWFGDWQLDAYKKKGKDRVLPCVASLALHAARQIDLPRPGKWDFHLAYYKDHRMVRVPVPELAGRVISESPGSLRVAAPIAVLRQARKRFEQLSQQK